MKQRVAETKTTAPKHAATKKMNHLVGGLHAEEVMPDKIIIMFAITNGTICTAAPFPRNVVTATTPALIAV